jgi:DNA-binding LacI/PurR family transcriptional regulator
MADVARRAGVSHQTVSRVLSSHPDVSDAARAEVRRAIAELGYHRNSAARALVTRRSHTRGVIAADTTLFGPASTVAALEEAARAESYLVSVVALRSLTAHALSEALGHFASWGVEGVVVITPQRHTLSVLADVPRPFPVVTVGRGHLAQVPSVSVDQHLGAQLATEHLLAAGHRTVWHITGAPEWFETDDREAGWRAALGEAGAPVPGPLPGDWSPLSGYRAGQQLAGLRGGRGPSATAVFVANDAMALGVRRALWEAGLRTPDDVALVGYDDIPEAEYFTPPLTTVRQDFAELGRASIRLLLDRIEDRGSPDAQLTVAPRLIVRASSVAR